MDSLFTALRVIVAFAVVIALLWTLQRKTRKWSMKSKKSSPVRVHARQSVGSKTSVVVVDIDSRRYVLGVGEGNVTVIDKRKVTATDFDEELARAASEDVDANPPAKEPAPRVAFKDALLLSVKNSFGGKR